MRLLLSCSFFVYKNEHMKCKLPSNKVSFKSIPYFTIFVNMKFSFQPYVMCTGSCKLENKITPAVSINDFFYSKTLNVRNSRYFGIQDTENKISKPSDFGLPLD